MEWKIKIDSVDQPLASSRFGNAVILDPEKSCLILNATAADLRLIADAMDRIAVLSEGD